MRIAVNGRFLTTRPTGVQRVARQLVGGLAQAADVTLFLPGRTTAPPGFDAVRTGRLQGIPWEQVELPLRTHSRFDVALDPANAGPLWGGPRVLILSDVFPVTHPDWYTAAFGRWFRLVVARAARRARRVVMFSEAARREAIATLGLAAGRVAVATQGTAPFDGPAPPDQVRAVLDRYGLEPGFLLATGAGDPRKNVEFLQGVLPRLETVSDAAPPTLVVVGAPYEHVHWRAAAPQRRNGGGPTGSRAARRRGVRHVGFVPDEDLHALYTAASAFCFPSLGEGFGRPPLEAMASGTPVLTADYDCAAEVLGDAAIRLPLEPASWAAALDRVLTDPAYRHRQAELGRAHAARYRWADAAQLVLDACYAAAREEAD